MIERAQKGFGGENRQARDPWPGAASARLSQDRLLLVQKAAVDLSLAKGVFTVPSVKP